VRELWFPAAAGRVVFLSFRFVIMSFFSSRGWELWDIASRPLIPGRMPVLIDDDLLFEDGPGAPRPSVAVSQWLRELPASGAPSPATWEAYARAVKEWAEFLALRGVGVFDSREWLKAGLSRYAGHRAAGPARQRFWATAWGRHMSILSLFYRWAMDEGHAPAEPFTYRTARALFAGTGRGVRVNLAVRRTPKPHVTIRYLAPDFTAMFLAGLRGLESGGTADAGYHGRELARNAAVAGLALATGLRWQEFIYLLPWEVPALPGWPATMPVPFPVLAGVTKGRKFRTTWVSYDALAGVHRYLELDRAATADGSSWRPPAQWGEPLLVTGPDERGGRVNGVRRRWETLTPGERRRLAAPGGGSCLLAVKNGGGPFTAWATVFERAPDRIRAVSGPRFPHVTPHRLRHVLSA
jgi:site-specific recombinase XerD